MNILFLTCVLLLSSCSSISADEEKSTKIKVNKTNINNNIVQAPNWYTNNNYKTSDDYLYGFGSSDSLDMATKNALANIIQNLETTVSTNTQIKKSYSNGQSITDISEQTNTSTENIVISKYKVIQKSESNGDYYILLEVNKQELSNHLQNQIKNRAVQINTIDLASSSIRNLQLSENISHNLIYMKNAISTLLLLDKHINIESYINIYNESRDKFNSIKNELHIYIDESKADFFYSPLKKYLQQNYKLEKNIDNANIKINITNKDFNEHGDYRGDYEINTIIELQAKDMYSDNLINKSYDIKSSSDKGRHQAITNAQQEFYNQLNNPKAFIE